MLFVEYKLKVDICINQGSSQSFTLSPTLFNIEYNKRLETKMDQAIEVNKNIRQ